jgi:outer membrane protein
MKTRRFCTVLTLAALASGQPPEHWYDRISRPYQAKYVGPVSFDNSPRIDSLLRGGKLYLSLDDAIALALENNLDIELQRFTPGLAETDLLRARGGATLRGLSLSINELPQGVGGPASPLLNLPASGVTPSSVVPNSLSELNSIVPTQSTASITGTLPLATGPAIPQFDPSLVGQLNWQHQTTPESNASIAGANALTGHNYFGSIGVQKGFGLGTEVSTSFNSTSQFSNSTRNTYNPFTTSNFGVNILQPLLRGFGTGVNRRFIRIARNNEKVSDLIFRQQVIGTVSGVIRLYFDLVSFQDDVQVKRQTLALAQRLYGDNKDKVDQGTLAPIELVRAAAQVAASRQDLANSEGFELQQELLLKTVLTRKGTANEALREARIVPTTPIDIPVREQVVPVPDLVSEAYRNRPELEEGRLQVANSEISLKGSRNGLLPALDLVGAVQNSGLAGQLNPLSTATGVPTDPALIGGFGSSVEQILRHNYPTYGIGIQLNLPLRNRVAQGDYARDQMQLRQTEVRFQQLANQVRLEVESALIAVQRSRAAYDAAVETAKLQEQSLQIELEKYANGVSTNFLVMQYQSYLAQARSTEVASRSVYVKARTALERALGRTLDNHKISIDEVYRGRISTPPAVLPAVENPAARF